MEIGANRHLTKDYVRPIYKLSSIKTQLKRGGAKLSALPKIKSLHNCIFQILERDFKQTIHIRRVAQRKNVQLAKIRSAWQRLTV